MRQAEIARAEEKARAEEATKRVRVEQDRLRLIVALAASILCLVILGGSGAAWVFQQRQARLAGVEATVARIQAIRDQAAADGADLARWTEALVAADQALGSIGDLAATEPGRCLAALRVTIAEDQAQAESDRKLIDELTAVRTSVGRVSWEIVPRDIDRQFAMAFRHYKLDLESTPDTNAVARLKSRPETLVREVVSSLDHWLIFRRAIEGGLEKMKRLIELAKELDPDPDQSIARSARTARPETASSNPKRDGKSGKADPVRPLDGPAARTLVERG